MRKRSRLFAGSGAVDEFQREALPYLDLAKPNGTSRMGVLSRSDSTRASPQLSGISTPGISPRPIPNHTRPRIPLRCFVPQVPQWPKPKAEPGVASLRYSFRSPHDDPRGDRCSSAQTATPTRANRLIGVLHRADILGQVIARVGADQERFGDHFVVGLWACSATSTVGAFASLG